MFDWLLRLFGLLPAPHDASRRLSRRRARAARSGSSADDGHEDGDEPTIAKGSRERDLVGEGSYARGLKKLMRGRDVETRGGWEIREVLVCLVREPSNRFDRNAIRADVAGTTVGYVPRDETHEFAPLLEALDNDGTSAICAGRIIGRDGRYGVKLLVTATLRLVTKPIELPPVQDPTRSRR